MECWQNGGLETATDAEQIWAVRFFLDREGQVRDRALFDWAIAIKLRGCDLVSGAEIRKRAI